MTIYKFTVDLNQSCTACGKPGRVVENKAGLCLKCIRATLGAPAASDPTPARGLSHSLTVLIQRAIQSRDRKFHSLSLPRGLYVEVGLGAQFNLRLYRRTGYPSAREWQTVIDYLPADYRPPASILPRDFKYTERDGAVRWYLEGHWPLPEHLTQE